ncbi:hypothetical protein C0583_06405 [Candidatus Parcubacteria bacterium]|nr:MAG: hypothetical protein C0583_06405 [Candidatus Parcubacteria bacterium]
MIFYLEKNRQINNIKFCMFKYLLIRFSIIAVIITLAFYATLYLMQEQIIFLVSKDYDERINRLGALDVYLNTEDDVVIHGLDYVVSSSSDYVVFFHGNGGNISGRVWQFLFNERLGLNTLMIDYRGYGKSEGKIKKEENLYLDAKVAWEYLVEEKKIDPSDIIIWGRSLGGAMAIDLATKVDNKALIVESSYSSILNMKRKYYHYVPDFFAKYKMKSDEKIGKVNSPVLIIHSREDEMIDFENAERLFEMAEEPKTFFELKGGHNEGMFLSEEEYFEEVSRFLASYFF